MQTKQPKIPFHYGLFYGAMCHWLGREPDNSVRQGFDGFYHFVYYPRNAKEENHFEASVTSIREWLDLFDIKFSGTRVDFHLGAVPGSKRDKLGLSIVITHEVESPKSK